MASIARAFPPALAGFGAIFFPSAASAGDHVVIGPAATIAPAYEGGRDDRVLPIPILDISYSAFFIDTTNGLGIKVIQGGPVAIGGSIGYVAGYRRRDAPAGVGRLADTAGGRLFVSYQAKGLRLLLGGTQSIGGTKGVTADAVLAYTANLNPRFSLTPSIATSWADRKYSDRYFGIDAGQSRASNLPQYQPGSGFRDVSLGASSRYALSRHFWMIGSSGARRLMGDDARSPIVRRKWGVLSSVGLAYVM